jgi:hypothetical protein
LESSPWGSALFSDDEFVSQVEACVYPIERFKHLDHVRLAWIYLQRHHYPEAESRMRAAIVRLACHHGAHRKYHVTITIAWMRLLGVAALQTPYPNFQQFAAAHPWLANKDALSAYYSDRLLSGENARQAWVDPDIEPLPSNPE